jgi:hypothetical protein
MALESLPATSVRYPELLLRIARQHKDARGAYRVDLSFTSPGTSAPTELDPGQTCLDLTILGEVLNDVDEYGDRLTRALFADADIRSGFESACALAASTQLPLRLRLQIDADAPELHGLRWETVRDLHGNSLATSEQILLSRYLRSPDWRRVSLKSESQLRALVVIASPTGLDQYRPEGVPLQPLDVAAELQRAKDALGDIVVTSLASGGAARLDALTRELRRGYDIVYLISHGAMVNGEPRLYLENEAGQVAGISGEEIVAELAELRQLPSLVVLASCESAGSGTSGALTALGPLLARVGVPTVLAMQGKISVETAQRFMEQFFVELRRDGQLDRAVAVARATVKAQPDAWMPVLFTRLRDGRLWSTPELTDSRFQPWDALLNKIEEGHCTPVLGPGLIEFLLGSPREVAGRWADRYRFPMALHDRQDLPQVAQFLAVNQEDPDFPRTELRKYLQDEMRDRYGDQLSEEFRGAQLDVLVREVWRQRRERDALEPHHVLASLPLPIYISTNPDNLLAEALTAVGKAPRVELCCWNDEIEWSAPARGREDRPDDRRPLVYHLFGQMIRPESLVLTDDDYFDYLIGVTKRDDIIPPAVGSAWSNNALLFLGFQVDDWNFRILFRSIMNQEGRARGKKKPHVAVQIDPEEGGSVDPLRARHYIERYFQDENVNIYWGSTEEFIRELSMRWQQRAGAARPAAPPLIGAAS